jgi:hypothetical protein
MWPGAMAWGIEYRLTPISTELTSAGSINRDGTVAYVLVHSDGRQQVLKTDMNGATTVVADTSGPLSSFLFSSTVDSTPTINDSGVVAFSAWFDRPATGPSLQGICVGDGGTLRTVVDSSGVLSLALAPRMNAAGQVLYLGFPKAGGSQCVVDTGGTTRVVAQNSGSHDDVGEGCIDDRGRVLYVAYSGYGIGNTLCLNDGGLVTEIARTGAVFKEFRGSAISDYQAAFVGTLADGSEAIYSYRNGALVDVLNTSQGFVGFNDVAVNNTGGMIFTGGTGTIGGIYTSADLSKPVVGIGDPFLGSTIASIELFPSLNDAGQFAFYAQLADYRTVLVRADVVPEPASLGVVLLLLMATCRFRRR